MFSLFLSICIPHWITIFEHLPPPPPSRESPFPQHHLDVHINIGLFSVCPHLDQENMQNFTLK